MGQPITTDNIDDEVRNALKAITDDIVRRLDRVERMVQEDLVCDKNQKNELPDENARLDQMYTSMEEIKNNFNLIREEMKQMREQLAFLNQKLMENQ
jgi:hypothetical protein